MVNEIKLIENIGIFHKVEYIEQIVGVIESLELNTNNIFTMLGLEFSILRNIENPILADY